MSHSGKQKLFKSSKIFTKTNVTLKNDNISIITFKILCVKYLPLFISYSDYCALFKYVLCVLVLARFQLPKSFWSEERTPYSAEREREPDC